MIIINDTIKTQKLPSYDLSYSTVLKHALVLYLFFPKRIPTGSASPSASALIKIGINTKLIL